MNRVIKFAGWSGAVALLGLGAVVVWFLVLFDPSDHRQTISDWIYERSGYRVAFYGPIEWDVGLAFGSGLSVDLDVWDARVLSIDGADQTQPLEIRAFNVNLRGSQFWDLLRGESFQAHGGFDLAGVDIRALTSELEVDWQIFLPNAFRRASGRGRFEVHAERLALSELDVVMAATPIFGTLSVSNWSTTPEVDFNFSIPTLQMDNLIPRERQNFFDGLVLLSLPAFSVAKVNATGSVAIGSLLSGGMAMTEVSIPIESRDGWTLSSPVTAKLYGGTAQIDTLMSIENGTIHFLSAQRLNQIEVGQALADIGVTKMLDARADLSVALEFASPDVSSGLESLQGVLALRGKEGRIRGIDLDAFIEQLAKGQEPDSSKWLGDTVSTPIGELLGTMKIDGGKASNRDLALRLVDLDARGAGSFEFSSETLDYQILLSLERSELAKLLPPPLNSGLLVLPLRVSGTREAPSVTLDMPAFLQMQFKYMMGGGSPIRPATVDSEAVALMNLLESKLQDQIKRARQ